MVDVSHFRVIDGVLDSKLLVLLLSAPFGVDSCTVLDESFELFELLPFGVAVTFLLFIKFPHIDHSEDRLGFIWVNFIAFFANRISWLREVIKGS